MSAPGSVVGAPDSTSTAPSVIVQPAEKTVAVAAPDLFHGDRTKLRAYLAQCVMYIFFNKIKFGTETKQVLWAMSFMRGSAFSWAEPMLSDYSTNTNTQGSIMTNMAEKTKQVFRTWKGFVDEATAVFGDMDERRTAARELQSLRQNGSVMTYTANFQRHAMRLGYGDEALKDRYYIGLKDYVKDEISRSAKPDELAALIKLAVDIDNRHYERSLERRGSHKPPPDNRKKSYQNKHDPMELDATTRKPLSKEVREKRRKENLCFECGLPGHQASAHKKSKTSKKASPKGQTRTVSAMNRSPLPSASNPDITTNIHPSSEESSGHGQLLVVPRMSPEEATYQADHTLWSQVIEGDSDEGHETSDTEDISRVAVSTHDEIMMRLNQEIQQQRNINTNSPEVDNPRWPQVGQTWEVVRREVIGSRRGWRDWMNTETQQVYVEPGNATNGPEWGEKYQVVYRDPHRIGWKSLRGQGTPAKTYMQVIPEEEDDELEWPQPQVGETWECYSNGTRKRIWKHTTRMENEFYFEKQRNYDALPQPETGDVYRVFYDSGTSRTWKNVLTDKTYVELIEEKRDPEQDFWDDETRQDINRIMANSSPNPRELSATSGEQQLMCNVRIGGKTARAMVDSGAMGNFMSPATVTRLGLTTELKEDPYHLSTVDGTPIEQNEGTICIETAEQQMRILEHIETIRFDIAPLGRHEIILGMPWMQKHNPTIDWKQGSLALRRCRKKCHADQGRSRFAELNALDIDDDYQISAISRQSDHHAQGSTLKQIPMSQQNPKEVAIPKEYEGFRDLFIEKQGKEALPQHGPWDHEIKLEEGKTPPFLKPYKLSEYEGRTLQEYVDNMKAKGHIRDSNSAAAAPVLWVDKKDNGRRLCVDYRKLNDMTIKDRYPLPLADELRDRLKGAKIFTKLDLRGAYNLVRMKEGEEWKTAFRTHNGLYEYLVMPFGLTNAPATCMRMMNDVLRPFLYKFCICYLDDIMVYSKNEEEHEEHVTKVLKALQAHQLQCKPEKCEFHTTRTTFLGYVVSRDGLAMDPSKVSAILEWEPPTCVKEVQSFLGLANYYRRFIKGYSGIATALTNLTRKDTKFEWTETAQAAFDQLKQAFTTAPILLTFDPEKPITVETDASDYAIGAVLSQPGLDSK